MNKSEYQNTSKKLKLPQRCPLVGYCHRWAQTIFLLSYSDTGYVSDKYIDVLKNYGELPTDFNEKNVPVAVDPPQIQQADDFYTFFNICPEVPLFQQKHCPGLAPQEAVTSMDWTKYDDIKWKEHKHFSECLEFIQNYQTSKKKRKRDSIPPKQRFEILKRDGYKCVYCGRGQKDGVTLHVDHKISVKDGGGNEPDNLVTACEECNVGKGSKSVKLDEGLNPDK